MNNQTSTVPASQSRSAGVRRFTIVMALVVVVIVLLAIWFGPDLIPFRAFAYGAIIRLLTSAFLIALFIERTNEVIINVWRGKGKAELNRQYVEARVAAGTGDAKESSNPVKIVLDQETKLEVRRAENQRYTLIIGFALGIVAAALGVRLLMPLLDGRVVDELSRGHRNLLIGFDVLITGTLLGGGASGLHSILDLAQKALDERRDSFRKAQQERDASAAGGR